MTTDQQRAHAVAGMRAAIEYLRAQHTGMAGTAGAEARGELAAHLVTVDAALTSIARDAAAAGLDITGAMASVTLRAASLAASVVEGMTVPKFLGLLEAEVSGWRPPVV